MQKGSKTYHRVTPLFLVGIFMGILSLPATTYGQQASEYTQYMYNTMSFNPAYTAARGRLSVLTLYRNQWSGIEGAPKTFNLSIDGPAGRTDQVGLGAEFISDEIGPSKQSTIAGNFSYVIPFENGFHLDFGIKGGVSMLKVDPNKLNIYDPNIPSFRLNNHTMPVLGVGAYFYMRDWYLGFSVPNLFQTKHYKDVKLSTVKEHMNFYFLAGTYIPIGANFYLKPITLIKAVKGAPVSVDVSVNSVLYDQIIAGVGYRFDASVSAMAGFQVNNQFMIGYSYDYDTTRLNKYNNGSHEVILRFEFGGKKEGWYDTTDIKNPLF